MSSYGQYCPIARAAEILNERWTLLVMRDLLAGARRFNDIRRGVPRMSPSLLSKRLKNLEACGMIARRQGRDGGPAEYVPTQAGRELAPILDLYGAWGQRWVRNRLGEDDLDAGLHMWWLRCGVDPDRFPAGRSVIAFEFTDRPRLRRGDWWLDSWWLVIDGGEADLCVTDPGFEVDLYVVTDLRTMARINMGDLALRAALDRDLIELHGAVALAGGIDKWLPRSPHAGVPRPPQPVDLHRVIDAGVRAAE